MDRAAWPSAKAKLAEVFRTRSQAQWCEVMEGSDVCFAPVLDFDAAMQHPHAQARSAFVSVAGVPQPAPAPRFSRTPAKEPTPPPRAGRDTDAVLSMLGFTESAVDALKAAGAVS